MIRSKAVESLVNLTRDVEESIKELADMGIVLDSPSYRVAVFDMDLYADMEYVDIEKRQESALMAFVLFNVSDEIVTREKAGIVYQEGSSRVCILFTGNRTGEFARKIREICKEIQSKVKEVIGIETSIGIGSWVRNPRELCMSYALAQKGIQCRYLLGGNLLMDMEEEKTDKELFIQEEIREFAEAVRFGKKENMDDSLNKMEEKIKGALVEKSRACMYLQQIVRTIDRVCEDVSVDMKRILSGRDELLHSITKQKSFDSACRIVEDYIMKIFKLLSDMNSSTGQRQARLAMNYIQKNYMDPDLSLNDICSYLNISTSYFSTIFKEMTGETFTEVLIRTRMEKAKELLENTTMKNYEIAEKVGFSDPHYFGISFKKMTGVTPTEYARERRR